MKRLDKCIILNKNTEMLEINLEEISKLFKDIDQYITEKYQTYQEFEFEGHRIRVGISRGKENKIRVIAEVITDNEYSLVLSSHLMEYSPVLSAQHNIRPLIENAIYNMNRLKETNECYLLE